MTTLTKIAASGVLVVAFLIAPHAASAHTATTSYRAVLVGSVTDIDSNGFTMTTRIHGNVSVATDTDTRYTGSVDELGDLTAGTMVVAYGVLDTDTDTLAATDVAVNVKALEKKDNGRGHAWGKWMKFWKPFFGSHW